MELQESDRLYIDLKKKLCDLIYKGIYREGGRIPPERLLAEEFSVSRITVRKTLELMERDGLVIREIGRGTSICFGNKGYRGNLDMVALVAPAKSTFFTEFIDYFQNYLDKNDTLLLYVQKPEKESIENCLYRLYSKEIRNVVVWPDDASVEVESLRRLRALGMNMVFFDTDVAVPYADCVYLDNEQAIRQLLECLESADNTCSVCEKVWYIGWDNDAVFSVRARQDYFQSRAVRGDCLHLSWKMRERLKVQVSDAVKHVLHHGSGIPSFLCGAGEIGVEVAKVLRREGIKDALVVSVDEFKDSKRLKVTTCGQDFLKTARQIYDCLKEQNRSSDRWKAACYPIQGVVNFRTCRKR